MDPQDEIEILRQAVMVLMGALQEYASEDNIARGNGYGCYSNPQEMIAPAIAEGQKALDAHPKFGYGSEW